MCVEKDNSAVKGNFFIDQGYPRASQVFSPGGTGSKQLGFHSYGREKATSPLNTIVGYQLGDPIAAYHYHSSNDGQTISNTLVTNAFGGYLLLPSPDNSGNCIELNTVSFGKSEAHACSKHTNDLAVDCEEGRFSAERYISNVFVEKTKGSAAGSSSSQGNTDALGSIRIAKFTDSSGVITSSTDLEDVPNNTMWDESSRTCTNALKSMTYNVRYNHTAIDDISVEIETIDILMDGSSTRGELQQEFAVNFIPIELQSSERSLDNNNVITRNRSGNPGYIVGAPVLGAMSPTDVNHTASYVIAQRAGLTVMDTGLVGQCNSSSTTGSVSSYMLHVAASSLLYIHNIQWPNERPHFCC